MVSISDPNGLPTPEYCGCILYGGFSVELKKRVAGYIDRYRSFEDTGSAAILYIAAWQGEKEKIWYEYTSQKFMNLLGCENSEVAEVFRNSIVDRRIYKDLDVDVGIRKEVKNREELNSAREALREEGKKAGTIEAVYKLAVNSSGAAILVNLSKDVRAPWTFPCSDEGTAWATILCMAGLAVPAREPNTMTQGIIQPS